LIPYVPHLATHLLSFPAKAKADEDDEALKHVTFFVTFLSTEYHSRLAELSRLLADEQITLNWITGLFLPGDILFTHSGTTGDPLAVRLIKSPQYDCRSGSYQLTTHLVSVQSKKPGLTKHVITIEGFDGAKRISDLAAYPFRYLEDPEEQRASLIKRGKKAWELLKHSWIHMNYNAIAYRWESDHYRKVFVKSRIMVDQGKISLYPHIPNQLITQLTCRNV